MSGDFAERPPGHGIIGGYFPGMVPPRRGQTHLSLKLVPFILIWTAFSVLVLIWLFLSLVPFPRPARRSEKTFRTVDQSGKLTEPEPLSCWYDDLARKAAAAAASEETTAASEETTAASEETTATEEKKGGEDSPQLDLAAEIEPAEVFMTVVVPAYNEQHRLGGMLEETVNFLEKEYGTSTSSKPLATSEEPSANGGARKRKAAAAAAAASTTTVDAKQSPPTRGWEVLLVNDGSTDNTLGVCEDFSRNHIVPRHPRRASGPWSRGSSALSSQTGGGGVRIQPGSIRMISLEENRGKGGAVTHGMRHARGQYVVFADADGASKFDDVAKLVAACQSQQDQQGRGVAVGSRAHLVGSEVVVKRSKLRNFLMHSFHLLLWLLTPTKTSRIRDTQCGFKLFSRQALPYIIPYMHMEGWIFDVEMLMLAEWSDIPVAEVPVGWKEVVGSKLNVVWDSLGMAWGLALLRICWSCGIYRR